MDKTEEALSKGEDTYRLLAKGKGFRIGLATAPGEAEQPSITIEFLVRLFWTGKRLEPVDMERALELVSRLTARGYCVFFEEDGWISCENPVGDADAEAEARHLQGLLGGR